MDTRPPVPATPSAQCGLPPPPGPEAVGIGWRQPHYAQVLEGRPALDFLEVHSENFLAPGGAARATLRAARALYPISLHGVGLVPGSACGLDLAHLERLAALVDEIDPALVSEHLCWGRTPDWHTNDLLPLPLVEEALELMCRHVDAMQRRLRRRVLVENISAYLRPAAATIPEPRFLNLLAERSGCALLLDINNLHVNACNFGAGSEAASAIEAIEPRHVAQYHLAGPERVGDLVVDTHGTAVPDEVWRLYDHALRCIGPRPTLIERDTAIPPLQALLDEVATARRHVAAARAEGHALEAVRA